MESSLLVFGISHHTASVEIRERYSVGESQLYPALHQLAGSPGIEEVVLLSTCNRTEFVLWCSDIDEGAESVRRFLTESFALETEHYGHFYRLTGVEALLHVFRVAASLDSLVVGEPQILGQVKAAWTKARQAGTTGRFLDRVFQKALSVSKHVRSDTAIGEAPVSIPYAAVALARRLFHTLENRNVLLVGSGKMSELSARHLLSEGVGKLWVTNRTYEHAEALARHLGGTAVRFEDRWSCLAQTDIILSSTGCPHIIFGREDAERIRTLRGGQPVFLIDIAVPRDVDPAVRELPGFFLYDIDDLEQVVTSNLDGRLAAAASAEKLVEREAKVFLHQIEGERVVPTIVALRAHLEAIRLEEVARIRADSKSDVARPRYVGVRFEGSRSRQGQDAAIEAVTGRIMDRLARELARELKQTEKQRDREELAAAVRYLFRLEQQAGVPGLEPEPESEPVSEPAACPDPASA